MDKVIAVYGYASAAHRYAVAWVAAHPVATVNAVIVAVAIKTVTVFI